MELKQTKCMQRGCNRLMDIDKGDWPQTVGSDIKEKLEDLQINQI